MGLFSGHSQSCGSLYLKEPHLLSVYTVMLFYLQYQTWFNHVLSITSKDLPENMTEFKQISKKFKIRKIIDNLASNWIFCCELKICRLKIEIQFLNQFESFLCFDFVMIFYSILWKAIILTKKSFNDTCTW